MRDNDAAEGIVRHLKPGDRGQEDIVARVGVKRPPEIKHQALAATSSTQLPPICRAPRWTHALNTLAPSTPRAGGLTACHGTFRWSPTHVAYSPVASMPSSSSQASRTSSVRASSADDSGTDPRPGTSVPRSPTRLTTRVQIQASSLVIPLAYSALKPAAISVSPIGRPRIVRQNRWP